MVTVERVLSVIANDPALSMGILRACNSAAAGVLTPVSSVLILDGVTAASDEQLTMTLAHARLCSLLGVVHAYEHGELTDDRITDPVRAFFEALQWSTRMVRSTRG